MKKTMRGVLASLLTLLILQTANVEAKNTYRPKSEHEYIRGKRGGCYYINKNGNKTYVDRSLCG